jgi:hypothetical protein
VDLGSNSDKNLCDSISVALLKVEVDTIKAGNDGVACIGLDDPESGEG